MLYDVEMNVIHLNICLVIVVLFGGGIGGGIAAASDLPDCPSDTNVLWNNCFGTITAPSGGKYVGEFKGSNFNGQGTLALINISVFKEGIWKDGEFQYSKTSIGKIKSLFNSLDKNVQLKLHQPTWWKRTVAQCDTEQCYKTELGLRLGFLQGVKDGVFIAEEMNPFRFKYFPEIFTRCRKNFKGNPTLQYSEILFSFEPLGPTFYEINLTKSGVNASRWSWLDWRMDSSGVIAQSMSIPIQTMQRHNMELNWIFVEDMSKTGELELWNNYSFQEKGAFYGRYEFDANLVRQCITEHKDLI